MGQVCATDQVQVMLQLLIQFNAVPDGSEPYRAMSQTSDPLRLTDLPDDTPARLAEVRGGHQLRRRLLALGLRQGSPLRILQRRGRGLVLASGELRIAIGAGIAEKLWVTPESDQAMFAMQGQSGDEMA
jgi:Fe2+ transport system protein A